MVGNRGPLTQPRNSPWAFSITVRPRFALWWYVELRLWHQWRGQMGFCVVLTLNCVMQTHCDGSGATGGDTTNLNENRPTYHLHPVLSPKIIGCVREPDWVSVTLPIKNDFRPVPVKLNQNNRHFFTIRAPLFRKRDNVSKQWWSELILVNISMAILSPIRSEPLGSPHPY